jgi:hypothetical protein
VDRFVSTAFVGPILMFPFSVVVMGSVRMTGSIFQSNSSERISVYG